MRKIGYKIGGVFEDIGGKSDKMYGFEILFPHIYDSYEDAEKYESNTRAQMEKLDSGEVVIQLFEQESLVKTIRWDEWREYRCYQLKEESREKMIWDAYADYEPCSKSFEELFEDSGNQKRTICPMQHLAYWIEPVFV